MDAVPAQRHDPYLRNDVRGEGALGQRSKGQRSKGQRSKGQRSKVRYKVKVKSNQLLVLVVATAIMAFTVAWPRTVQTHGSLTTTVLFDREIVRILNQRCVMCHTEDGLAFPLETYEQTWLRGRSMRTSVLRRHMPPWPAVAGYGEFVNDNRLTLRETQFLVSWVEGL